MDRRRATAAAGAGICAVLAGCGTLSSRRELERRELPDWPDDPAESAVVSYAIEYAEAALYNRRLDERRLSTNGRRRTAPTRSSRTRARVRSKRRRPGDASLW